MYMFMQAELIKCSLFFSTTLHPLPLHSLRACLSDSFTTAMVLHPQSSQLKKVNIDFSSELQSSSLYYLIKYLEQDLFFYVDQQLNFRSVHSYSFPPTAILLCIYRDCLVFTTAY